MKRPSSLAVSSSFLAIGCFLPIAAAAQSSPTASRALEPSVFLGVSGVYTGLESARNASITAGVDIGFRQFFGFSPALEFRGTYPVHSGQVAGEESAEGGLRVGKRYNHFRPYADILIGRGELNYQNGGYIVPSQSFRYIQSTTNVISPGIGVDLDVTDHYAVLIDGQFQHWDLPFSTGADPATPGSIYSKVLTIGVVYRFGWLDHGHPAP